jgi:redox-sensitive bicupin YhaK (pirin superfamily)
MGNFKAGSSANYSFKKEGNGLYVFVIKGKVQVEEQELNLRDGIGIWCDASNLLTVQFQILADAELLLMEVPLVQ